MGKIRLLSATTEAIKLVRRGWCELASDVHFQVWRKEHCAYAEFKAVRGLEASQDHL